LSLSAVAGHGARRRRISGIDPPQHPATTGKIEVLEFFSYGCPHCNEFYPFISAWAAKLPKDVVFKRVATGLGRMPWTNLARMYYALETTGDLTRLDAQVFHAIHEEHAPLFDEKRSAEWVGKHGVDVVKFNTAFESFGVNTKVNQAEEMVENLQGRRRSGADRQREIPHPRRQLRAGVGQRRCGDCHGPPAKGDRGGRAQIDRRTCRLDPQA
jgi:thiol-disulfide isomerase/thioredoxin